MKILKWCLIAILSFGCVFTFADDKVSIEERLAEMEDKVSTIELENVMNKIHSV